MSENLTDAELLAELDDAGCDGDHSFSMVRTITDTAVTAATNTTENSLQLNRSLWKQMCARANTVDCKLETPLKCTTCIARHK